MTLWSGRFTSPMDETLWDLSESYSFDHVLYAHDIAGSEGARAGSRGSGTARARMKAPTLLAALDEIREEFDERCLRAQRRRDEDVHMAIERRATELAGDVGAKLHTARSRNDQVATTLRLFTRDAVTEVASATLELVDVARRDSASVTRRLPAGLHASAAGPAGAR